MVIVSAVGVALALLALLVLRAVPVTVLRAVRPGLRPVLLLVLPLVLLPNLRPVLFPVLLLVLRAALRARRGLRGLRILR